VSQGAPGCSRRCQARTKSASPWATVLLVTSRVSTVLQQILQHDRPEQPGYGRAARAGGQGRRRLGRVACEVDRTDRLTKSLLLE
jgi:hypothetical protein